MPGTRPTGQLFGKNIKPNQYRTLLYKTERNQTHSLEFNYYKIKPLIKLKWGRKYYHSLDREGLPKI